MGIINDKFSYKGRLWPKYKLIEQDGEELAIFTLEWKEYLAMLSKEVSCGDGY